jgi:putative two-component system response regulator
MLDLPTADIRSLHRGGFLHDIGKISIPDSILFKPGSLTDDEWTVMRQHTTTGEAICRPMKSLAGVLPIIRNHHERWDGSGYPDGLRGEDIPLLARILQLADIYDALISSRPYKQGFSHEEALNIMKEEAKRGWRDRKLVAMFAQISGAELEESATEINTGLSLAQMGLQLAASGPAPVVLPSGEVVQRTGSGS